MHKKELLLIGGRAQLGGAVHEYLAEIAKPEGMIGYIGLASTDHDRWQEKLKEGKAFYQSKGIKVVDVTSQDDCYGLGVVYLHGGWSRQLAEKLRETGIDQLLRQAWKTGDVVLAGSSAGAMVLFWEMLDEDKDENLSLDLIDGIGPMSGGFAVPHFSNWISEEYKRDLIEKYSDRLIVGIDENTALRWRRGVCDVLGVGKVTLLGRSSGVFGPGEEFDLASTKQ